MMNRRNLLSSSGVLAAFLVAWAPGGLARSVASDAPGGTPTTASDTAVFAGGCFWCMEGPFDHIDGVLSTTSGYAGGHVPNPTYEEVSSGGTGHRESVEVVYDPAAVTYDQLLHVYWRNVDPLDEGGQFCDRGSQYTTAIFARNDEQAAEARASREQIQKRFDRPIRTSIVTDFRFYPAEDYHQDYYEKNPIRYKAYRWNCGRDRRLKELWGDEAGGH